MATSTGYYIYGVSDCNKYIDIQGTPVGESGPVKNLPYQGIGILCSTVNAKTVKPTRKNLIPHQKMLESIMKKYTILPVRFGTIAQSKGALLKGIKENLAIIKMNLNRFNGKRELNVKAFWEKGFIYNHILKGYPEIKEFRDSIENMKGAQTYFQKIEVGKMIERALLTENSKESEKIINELSPPVIQYKKTKTFGELMLLNLSLLVSNSNEQQLDKLVNKAAEKRKGRLKFKYTGPTPPVTFTNIKLNF